MKLSDLSPKQQRNLGVAAFMLLAACAKWLGIMSGEKSEPSLQSPPSAAAPAIVSDRVSELGLSTEVTPQVKAQWAAELSSFLTEKAGEFTVKLNQSYDRAQSLAVAAPDLADGEAFKNKGYLGLIRICNIAADKCVNSPDVIFSDGHTLTTVKNAVGKELQMQALLLEGDSALPANVRNQVQPTAGSLMDSQALVMGGGMLIITPHIDGSFTADISAYKPAPAVAPSK